MKKLKKVIIPKNVKTIGNAAFYKCSSLKTVKIKSTKLKGVGKNAFNKISRGAVIDVPNKKVKAYKELFKKAKISSAVKIK